MVRLVLNRIRLLGRQVEQYSPVRVEFAKGSGVVRVIFRRPVRVGGTPVSELSGLFSGVRLGLEEHPVSEFSGSFSGVRLGLEEHPVAEVLG